MYFFGTWWGLEVLTQKHDIGIFWITWHCTIFSGAHLYLNFGFVKQKFFFYIYSKFTNLIKILKYITIYNMEHLSGFIGGDIIGMANSYKFLLCWFCVLSFTCFQHCSSSNFYKTLSSKYGSIIIHWRQLFLLPVTELI